MPGRLQKAGALQKGCNMIAMFLAAALAPHDYYTSGTTANVLLPTCGSQPSNRADFCSGYILASYDQLSRRGLVCSGEGVSNSQVIAVTLKYVNERPELWARDSSFLIEQALTRAFPCRK